MEPEDMSYDKICLPKQLGLVPFPKQINFTAAMNLCSSLKGHLPQVWSKGDENLLIDIQKQFEICGAKTWIDLWDEIREGLFLPTKDHPHSFGAIKNDYNNWDLGEPNGDRVENCVFQGYNGWNDYRCDETVCTVCNITTVPTFTMRGSMIVIFC